jgi:hypothetical protein
LSAGINFQGRFIKRVDQLVREFQLFNFLAVYLPNCLRESFTCLDGIHRVGCVAIQ